MQKKLIALAVAGLAAAPAFAQTNVTIYGRADAGFVSRGSDDGSVRTEGTKSEIASGIGGGSRFGLRGSEDLGSGLKAIFQMEFNVSLDSANISADTSGLGSRNSWVGLTGNFGTALLGRVDGARYGVATKYDPFGSGYVGAMASLQTHATRGNNAVVYITPDFSGFKVLGAYSNALVGGQETGATAPAGTNAGAQVTNPTLADPAIKANTGDVRLWAIIPSFEAGPLSVSLDYESFEANEVDDTDGEIYVVAGSYDFGVAKLHAYWEQVQTDFGGAAPNTRNGYVANGTDDAWDQQSWMLGVTVPVMGNASIRASYVALDDKTEEDALGRQRTGDCEKYSIGFTYNFSKRTNLFADYAQISNDDNGTCTIGYTGTTGSLDAGGALGPAGGYGTRGFDLGIAHVF